MDGFSFVITPLFLLNGTLALNRLLPSEERAVGVFVIANFCLETRSYGTHCMLELAPPRGLEALRLVRDRTRKASEAPSRVGERIDLTLSPGALGIPSIRADGFSAMQDWEPTPEIEGMFISKRATLAKLIQDGQVSARGHFSEGSVARAELRSLGIPTR